jgi:hypothetical protein
MLAQAQFFRQSPEMSHENKQFIPRGFEDIEHGRLALANEVMADEGVACGIQNHCEP